MPDPEVAESRRDYSPKSRGAPRRERRDVARKGKAAAPRRPLPRTDDPED